MASFLCGSSTASGCPCRAKVSAEGMKCQWHKPVEGDSTCSVCMEPMTTRNSRELECGHTFHKKCLRKWKLEGNRTCPLCREEFDLPLFDVIVSIVPRTEEYQRMEFDASRSARDLFENLGMNQEDHLDHATQMTLEAEDLGTLRSVLERIGIDLSDTDLNQLIRDTEES